MRPSRTPPKAHARHSDPSHGLAHGFLAGSKDVISLHDECRQLLFEPLQRDTKTLTCYIEGTIGELRLRTYRVQSLTA